MSSHTYSPKQADYKQAAFTTNATPDTATALAAGSTLLARRVGFRADPANTAAIKLRPGTQSGGGYYIELSAGDDYWIQAAPETVIDIASWVAESSAAAQTLRAIYQDI